MSLPWNVNASMGGAGVNDQILRSLRFRNSASAYLNRTPSSAGNRRTWTFSFWAKLANLGTGNRVLSTYTASTDQDRILIGDTLLFATSVGGTQYTVGSNNIYRDPSAWYHFVVAIDTTQATANNRMRLYTNGVEVSYGTQTMPPLNTQLNINNTIAHWISGYSGTSEFFGGYLAEVNFIDGQQLTPASFGYNDPVTGVWQPAPFKGTYGTNGFYLPFTDIATTSGSNFGLGRDYSGNSNYWNTNNISVTAGTTYDSMIDSPTNFSDGTGIYNRGNYAVLNPTQPSGGTYQAGNQQFLANTAGQWKTAVGTMFATSGKYYWEVTAVVLATAGYVWGGAASSAINLASSTYNGASALPIGGDTNSWGVGVSGGNIGKYYNGSFTTITAGTDSVGDVWMIAVDIDAAKIWFGRNGTWLGSGDPATGANAAFTNLSGAIGPGVSAYLNSGSTAGLNCGQRPFSYTPPTGYKALNTFNLPTPTIANGAAYMAATLFTGNVSTNTINNGANTTIGTSFQPDMVWLKSRSNANNHTLYDSIRGINDILYPNLTNAAVNSANNLTSFNSNGYTLGANENSNDNAGESSVGWSWKGGSTGVTNTSGSITSTVSANTTAGFSVVLYTGNSTIGATVGHGLGVAPNMIILKPRNAAATNWIVYHSSYGNTGGLVLNLTNAAQNQLGWWNNTSPSSTVFTLGGNPQANYGDTNFNYNYVAYCFAAVRGFSAFGSYVGNGTNPDGPFVFTGFRPRWVMIKGVNRATLWEMYDTSRNTYNLSNAILSAESSSAESTSVGVSIDILSNGFKIRNPGAATDNNASGETYIYTAFSENPFNYSRAR